MDFLSTLRAIVVLFGLVLLYSLRLRWAKSKKSDCMGPPEPPGAWPIIGHLHLLRGPQSFDEITGAMADKYGPAFMLRLGMRRTLVVSSWELVKDCFTTNDKALASRPTSALAEHLGYNYAMFASAPYGPYWRDIRKIIMVHLLSNGPLENFKPVRSMVIDGHMKKLYGQWLKNQRHPVKVNIQQRFRELSLDGIMAVVTGKPFFTAVDGEVDGQRFLNMLDQFFHNLMAFVPSDVIPFLKWMDWQGQKSGMKKLAREFDSIMDVYLAEHRQKRVSTRAQTEQKDFMDVMLSIMEEAGFSGYDPDTIIKANCLSLIIAGAHSTAVHLSAAVAFVLNNAHVLKQAQKELDVHVSKDRHVAESDVKNLVYIQAIIKETLRLSPQGSFLPLHEATEDCDIGGFHVQAGTWLLVNSKKLHRDPQFWSDPFEFQPERFLTAKADVDVRGGNFEYVPFGSGRRSCPGISMALHVMHVTLARVIHGFELSRPSDAPLNVESLGKGGASSNPVEVVIFPRLPPMLYE